MPFLLIVASLTPKSYSFMIGTKRIRLSSCCRTSEEKLRTLSMMSHDISKPETDRLIKQANAWCALNGLLYSAEDAKFTMAPVALIPNTFSKSAFEYAQNVQPILNELVDILSRDKDFLFENLASVGESDEFVKRLLGQFGIASIVALPTILKKFTFLSLRVYQFRIMKPLVSSRCSSEFVLKEPLLTRQIAHKTILQSASISSRILTNNAFLSLTDIYGALPDEVIKESVHLGLHRSDYMINVDDQQVEVPLQVEINTIASSFGCLSKKVGDFHRFMLQRNANSEAYQNLMINTGGGASSQVRRVFNVA